MMAFSCVAPVIAMDGEPSAPKDPFADLRKDLRDRRMNADNALYADKMVEGAKAIEAVNAEKMTELEKDRQDKRRKISSASWYLFWSRPEMDSWVYAENEDTVVYKEDEALNKKSDGDKKYYTDLANGYKTWANILHTDVEESEPSPYLKKLMRDARKDRSHDSPNFHSAKESIAWLEKQGI